MKENNTKHVYERYNSKKPAYERQIEKQFVEYKTTGNLGMKDKFIGNPCMKVKTM